MPPNVYDQASRYAARIDPPGFFAWALGMAPDRVAFGGWLDTRNLPFPGDPDRTGDTVARLDADPAGPPWAVAVEFQSRPDPDMFGRLLVYLGGLWLGLRPDPERGSRFEVGAVVVNLTGTGSAARRMAWDAAGPHAEFRPVERNLEAEPAGELLAGVEAGRWSRCVLPWVPLLLGADAVDVIERWKRSAEAEPDRRRKSDYGALAKIFAERAGRKDVWATRLEGWNVEESTVVNEWIAQGEARGEARGHAMALVEVLEEKFGPPPADLAAAVRRTTDLAKLRAWMSAAIKAAGLDEFRKAAGV